MEINAKQEVPESPGPLLAIKTNCKLILKQTRPMFNKGFIFLLVRNQRDHMTDAAVFCSSAQHRQMFQPVQCELWRGGGEVAFCGESVAKVCIMEMR